MQSKKIGILCAADTELAPFLPLIKPCAVAQKAMLTFYEGNIEETPVVAAYSGVCRVNAAVATQIMIDHFHVQAVVNAGTAGGMDPSVGLFDVVVAQKCAYHDLAEDILTEFHPWMPSVFFEADTALLAAARRAAQSFEGTVWFGTVVTGEAFIEGPVREEIVRQFSPLAVDMETAGAAHVCYVNRIPFLSARAVTDTPEHEGSAAFEQNCERAAGISKDFVLQLLKELDDSSQP